jgi:hypothetical protein
MNKYRVCARRNQSVMELYVDLMNLKGEWIEVFHSIDAEEVRRYLRTRTDPEAEITWEVA